MIYLRKTAQRATETQARQDFNTGYSHGINNLNPPTPDDLSPDYWSGYSKGQRDMHATADYYPDSHEGRGF